MGRARIALAGGFFIAALASQPAGALAAPEGDAFIETDSFNVAGDSGGDGQAFCPDGTRVVGGGVTVTTAGSSSVVVSGPLDETGLTAETNDGDVGRSWYAQVYNFELFERTFKATALCSKGSDATLKTDPFTLTTLGELGDGQAFCPEGTRVVGGGVTGTAAVPSAVRVSGPLDETGLTSELNDGDVGRSWYAKVIHSDTVSNTYKSTAICSPGSDATLRVDSFPPPTSEGQAFCPEGTRVVGGGVTSTTAGFSEVQVSGPLNETGLSAETGDGDVGRSWYANVDHMGGNIFKSTAICAAASPAQRCGGQQATTVGTAGPDQLAGTGRRDVILGLGGRDRLRGLAGNDLLCGGNGRDRLIGGRGRDRLRGGGGRDRCIGGVGADAAAGCERRRSI